MHRVMRISQINNRKYTLVLFNLARKHSLARSPTVNMYFFVVNNNPNLPFLLFQAFLLTSLLFLIIGNDLETEAHISLTFPAARKYNLDYLDSLGSPPPCGMPKGSVKTSLIAGSRFNVTWHLGYPHRGSYRLEILSPNGTELYTLVTENETTDTTAQRHEVELPEGFTCEDCIIRLKRQSGELGNSLYSFWSCGDVDIVERDDYIETCSGNGRVRSDEKCACRSGFWGKYCQYENECRNDDDCTGGRGVCIDLRGTVLPRKQCFCRQGFIGKRCSKMNKIGNVPIPDKSTLTEEFLLNNYLHQVLDKTARFHFHWRIIEGDKLQLEVVMRVLGTSYVGLGWRALSFNGDCTRYPVNARSRFSREAMINSTDLNREQRPPPRPKPPHPMSCTDVVIGQARGKLYRILDSWSGDISTPREDSLYDGTDDIEAGAGWEDDGVTVIIFRKKMHSKDIRDIYNDWPLDIPLLVIWARGQQHGEYKHVLPSGVDPGQPASVPKFYVEDELKYHGFDTQRGAFSINFLEPGTREFFATWGKNVTNNRR